MESTRKQIQQRRDLSRDRVRRTTLVLGATAAVTSGVLAVGLGSWGPSTGTGTTAQTPSRGFATVTTTSDDGSSDDTGTDDGAVTTTQSVAQAPTTSTGHGSASTSGGS